MKKRFVALLLVLILCISTLSITVNAVSKKYTITIDLTKYSGDIKNALVMVGGQKTSWTSELSAGTEKTFTIDYDRDGSTKYVTVQIQLGPSSRGLLTVTPILKPKKLIPAFQIKRMTID